MVWVMVADKSTISTPYICQIVNKKKDLDK